MDGAAGAPPPGERELRAWLDRQGHPGKDAWVDRLGDEVDRRLAAREPGTAVRLLELAITPSSPVFGDLTGPPAKVLADRVETARNASGAAATTEGPWDARFAEVTDILRHWVRYRRVLEREARAERGGPEDAEQEAQAFQRYYHDWILGPFRENVLRILEARGLSRRKFCETMRISEAYLSQVLNGKRTPTLQKLADLSWALRTEFWRLFVTRGRVDGESVPPWRDAWQPEPGDREDWKPGTVNRPYDALERHFKLVFYPGPDLPGEKIPARSWLIVDPRAKEMKEGERWVLLEAGGAVAVASFAGTADGGMRFVGIDGRRMGAAGAVGKGTDASGAGAAGDGSACVGVLRGVLVEL